MRENSKCKAALTAAVLALPLSNVMMSEAFAEDLIGGHVCVGGGCGFAPFFGSLTDILVMDTDIRLQFVDTTLGLEGELGKRGNWGIEINDVDKAGSKALVGAGEERFSIVDESDGTTPFTIRGGAPDHALFVASDGDVGLGTDAPVADLHIVGKSDTDDVPTFRLAAGNTKADFDVIAAGGGSLKIDIDDGDDPELVLDAASNLTIRGVIKTAGSCAGGCDRVFDPDYTLRTIEEHAAVMWDKGHLPAVGPTVPGAPVNLSEKTLRMLNELEHAHIYIEELHSEIVALTERTDRLAEEYAALAAQNSALRAKLAVLNATLTERLTALEAAAR